LRYANFEEINHRLLFIVLRSDSSAGQLGGERGQLPLLKKFLKGNKILLPLVLKCFFARRNAENFGENVLISKKEYRF
jgi:hypothetical protein